VASGAELRPDGPGLGQTAIAEAEMGVLMPPAARICGLAWHGDPSEIILINQFSVWSAREERETLHSKVVSEAPTHQRSQRCLAAWKILIKCKQSVLYVSGQCCMYRKAVRSG